MMMYGLPVVASVGFCVGDMFQDGINAKVVRIGNRAHSEEFEKNCPKHFWSCCYLTNYAKSWEYTVGNYMRPSIILTI